MQMFRALEKRFTRFIIAQDVAVMVGTLIGSGEELIKEHNAEHVIVQEAARCQNAELFVALAVQSSGTIHTSDDCAQTGPSTTLEDPFNHYAAMSLRNRLTLLGHPSATLIEQYRSIPVIGDNISKIWYEDKVQSPVSPDSRPNVARVNARISKPSRWR